MAEVKTYLQSTTPVVTTQVTITPPPTTVTVPPTTVTVTPSTPATRSVTYNGNGNTGGTVHPTDATVTVLGNSTLSRTVAGNPLMSYSFDGWNTTAVGSGTSYNAGATFTMGTANVTLYAKWKRVPIITP